MDQVQIETPELISLELPLAGVGSRAVALLCDMILQMVAMIVVVLLLGALSSVRLGFRGTWAGAVMILAGLVVYTGYYAAFEVLWSGRTPGKKIVGIRVIKEDGRNLTVLEAILRNLMRLVDQLPGIYVVGFVTMLIDRRNRRLGDMVAGSLVVHESRPAVTEMAWTAPAGSVHVLSAAARSQLGRLTLQDLELLETFLNRRLDLSAAVREKTETEICERMGQRLGLPSGERPHELAFLESLARELRDHLRFR